MSKNLNIIRPIPFLKFEGKLYCNFMYASYLNEMSKYFTITLYSTIQEVEEINPLIHTPITNRSISIHHIFEDVSIKHLLKNVFYYTNKIRKKLSSNDVIFINYNYRYVMTLYSFLLRKYNLALFVGTDPPNLHKIHSNIVVRKLRLINYPLFWLVYNSISKIAFKNNLIFYASDIIVNKNNRINQISLLDVPKLNSNKTIAPKKINYSIVFIGREDTQKNIPLLLKGIQNSKFRDKITLNIIGMNSFNNKTNITLSENLTINFKGKIYRRDLFFNEVSKSNILLLTSNYEKQGRVQLEAMSCGVVPICTDSGGVHRTINSYYNGVLVKANDSTMLARKIDEIFENKKLYFSLQKNCLDYSSKLSEEEFVKQTAQIISNFYKL